MYSIEFILLRYIRRLVFGRFEAAVQLLLMCVNRFIILDELCVGISHWFCSRKLDFGPIFCVMLPIWFILKTLRLFPGNCGIMPSCIIARRQGFLVAMNPSCGPARVG